ncbi:MAG: hypothetical protein E7105_10180 [Prevotella sp.]|nr:hypothetical protein [Prevotella sp.]
MKRNLITLATVLCCLVTMVMFSACDKDLQEVKNELVGTWTEKNNLFTDILTFKEDGTFSFQSHIKRYNGSGTYSCNYITNQNPNGALGNNGNNDNKNNVSTTRTLVLNFTDRGIETLEISKITSSKLEMTDRYGNTFHFSK